MMAWISSSFEDVKTFQPSCRQNKSDRKSYWKPLKKLCVNLWVDEYFPSVEDLAVHKKKIQEVQNWLMESGCKVKERKILLLTGPPGSAKSTAVRTLSREMNINIREWSNPDSSKQDYFNEISVDYSYRREENEFSMNQSERFSDFIFRSSKYKNICLNERTTSDLILIEELPNVFTMNPFEFQQIMRKYSARCTAPIVFIISEIHHNNLLKNLFPSEFQKELFITNIVFNPISTSLLVNALTRILNLTNNANSAFFESVSTSKKQFLQEMAERSGGDVRSAVNILQFAMMRDDVGVVSQKAKSKKDLKGKALPADFIGCKDPTLILFRALGKILYCKRETIGMKDDAVPLPPHLRHHERSPLLENPEDVFERSASDSSTFSLFLHHNCLAFYSNIDDFSAAVQYLGDSDILSSIWDPSKQLRTYSSSVSIRGMMHSLKGGQKGTQTFRSFTRPSWYTCFQTSKERWQGIKHLNRSSAMTSKELTSIYVPLLSKICFSSATVDRFVKEVGLLYPPLPERNGAKEIDSSIDKETPFEIPTTFEDDEFLIEEIED